jgi:dihydroxyacid dehydratase/phosphogluconate dehydratase
MRGRGANPSETMRSARWIDMTGKKTRTLRSADWFNDASHPLDTAAYIERYMNYGRTREELQSGRPIIGIAQSGSDLSPCSRHYLQLAQRVRVHRDREYTHILRRFGTPRNSQ